MTRYRVRFTEEAVADLMRLYDFLAERDVEAAEAALHAIKTALGLLRFSPYSCRRAIGSKSAALRELVIPFGKRGYVALFEIEERAVSIIAVRHQREDDFH
jgi:plasmid stabilization system protein ParE